jgi:histidinol dehydrogenase
MKRIIDEEEILAKRWPSISASNKELLGYVRPIVSDVAERGDPAVKEYTERFDKVSLDSCKVSPKEIEAAYKKVSQREVDALNESRSRLEKVEAQRLAQNNFVVEIDGTTIRCTLKPIQTVGCYVPGGKAAYPSSVVMNVAPAKVAGVERVVVCTPPGKDDGVDPLTLVACDVCMVDEVYKIGGVQAIAAMAYGTETVPRVDKIVGPGNQYVTAAKTIVSDIVSIDKPAGPSEILVIADESANPRLIAVDLISQAEHGAGGISGLVTTSEALAEEVVRLVDTLVPGLERGEIVSDVLKDGGFIYTVSTIEEAIAFANRFAPEHLEIMTERPEDVADRITNSGLILLGDYSPVSSTDYCMGVNHVLPTEGYAKVSSGITVLDYMKPVSIVNATKTGLGSVRSKVAVLSEAEGLPNHKMAVEARFK